ncbi:MAG: multicomponent Na+:H+ antiporter subunit D [Sulfurimonas sp.]|jgi:multicomponent Na+:H+ antiporter subunit D|uniref:complex I subunit 5 family protein n=1 Tax=Sulfurimonas sp. TaxID=2022749 RepID=UPI0039E3CD20
MSSILFIALPLLFGFTTPILNKLSKSGVVYTSTIMQAFLLYLAFTFLNENTQHIEIISIAAPLGISFVLNTNSLFFVALFTFLMLLFSLYYISHRKTDSYKNETKFFILLNMLLASSIGLVLSSDIFNIYVFFELAGISAYILSAYQKTSQALEAGLKYLITGAVASVFLLFAITLIYINIGSLNLAIIAQNFETLPYNLKLLISILLLIGFGFKVEIFPLNFWVTDVYQGSSTLINALFSAIVVKAYLFVFFHIMYLFLPSGEFSLFLVYLGALSMLVAEIVGLAQTNLKRLFAYSSLGQVALIFTAFALQNEDAILAALFIVLAHSIAKFIIFLALTTIEKEHKSVNIEILKELNSPFIRAIMLIAMLSILGIPLFAGFVGKFLVLKSLALNGLLGILLIIVFASLLEAVYYFRLSGFMFSKGSKREPLQIDFTQKVVFILLASLLIIIGVAPFLISEYLSQSATVMLDATSYISNLGGGSR